MITKSRRVEAGFLGSAGFLEKNPIFGLMLCLMINAIALITIRVANTAIGHEDYPCNTPVERGGERR